MGSSVCDTFLIGRLSPVFGDPSTKFAPGVNGLMHTMALERMNLAYSNVLVKLFVIAHISVSVFGWVLGCVVFEGRQCSYVILLVEHKGQGMAAW